MLARHDVEDLEPLGDDLGTDAVTGDDAHPMICFAHGSTLRDRLGCGQPISDDGKFAQPTTWSPSPAAPTAASSTQQSGIRKPPGPEACQLDGADIAERQRPQLQVAQEDKGIFGTPGAGRLDQQLCQRDRARGPRLVRPGQAQVTRP